MLGNEDWESTLPAFLPKALAMALRICGNLATAEDVVQEAIVKIVQTRGSFRGQAKLETWMLQIVLNASRDALRRQRRPREHPPADVDCDVAGEQDPTGDPLAGSAARPVRLSQPDLADPTLVDPAVEQRRRETREQVRQAVQQLPDRQREVVQLLIWHGLPAGEVAALLATTVQNVYANYHAAKQQLKRDLPPDLTLEF
jgi:RNA polymerase sigma-70 factor (ECF subfamily)